MSSSGDWKQGLFGCAEDSEVCMDGLFCTSCLTFMNAKNLDKPACLYTSFWYCLFPCVPVVLLRQEARQKYGIEGSIAEDVLASICCLDCVTCQTAAEIKHQQQQLEMKTEVPEGEKELRMKDGQWRMLSEQPRKQREPAQSQECVLETCESK